MLLELIESDGLGIVKDLDGGLFPFGCFSLVNLKIHEFFKLEVEISCTFSEKQVNLRGAALGLQLPFAIKQQLKLIQPSLAIGLLICQFLR